MDVNAVGLGAAARIMTRARQPPGHCSRTHSFADVDCALHCFG